MVPLIIVLVDIILSFCAVTSLNLLGKTKIKYNAFTVSTY